MMRTAHLFGRGDFSKIKPIAAWKDNMGCVTMTYNAPLKKYFMCVTDGGNTFGYFNSYILESDRMTGPWKLVTYMKRFGEQGYFVNIPSKFIGTDGRKMGLSYSANFGDRELPDDFAKGLEVKFAPKKIQWLIFVVEKTKGTAQNIGLSEIAVLVTMLASRQQEYEKYT